MIWLTWRQHRFALLAAVLLLVAAAVPLLLTGLDMRASFDRLGVGPCVGHSDSRCLAVLQQFSDQYRELGEQWLPWLNFVPALLGVFIGAPLLAAELERGTHRLVWTQGVTRYRWLAAKLALLSLGTVLAAVAFTAMLTWWRWPLDQLEGHFTPNVFDFEGLVPTAYALCSVALGTCVGVLVRRTLPAMAVTLAVFFVVRYPLLEQLVRPHYLPPVIQTVGFRSNKDSILTGVGNWVLDSGLVDPAGRRVDHTTAETLARHAIAAGRTPDAWYRAHGYLRWIAYQPADRFWTFQLIEAGIFAALAIVLLWSAIRLVRRAT